MARLAQHCQGFPVERDDLLWLPAGNPCPLPSSAPRFTNFNCCFYPGLQVLKSLFREPMLKQGIISNEEVFACVFCSRHANFSDAFGQASRLFPCLDVLVETSSQCAGDLEKLGEHGTASQLGRLLLERHGYSVSNMRRHRCFGWTAVGCARSCDDDVCAWARVLRGV